MRTPIEQAIEALYNAMANDNYQIMDEHIEELKAALAAEDTDHVVFDTRRLKHKNRKNQKALGNYFKERGVNVTFEE